MQGNQGALRASSSGARSTGAGPTPGLHDRRWADESWSTDRRNGSCRTPGPRCGRTDWRAARAGGSDRTRRPDDTVRRDRRPGARSA